MLLLTALTLLYKSIITIQDYKLRVTGTAQLVARCTNRLMHYGLDQLLASVLNNIHGHQTYSAHSLAVQACACMRALQMSSHIVI